MLFGHGGRSLYHVPTLQSLNPFTCAAWLLQGVLILVHRLQAAVQQAQLLQLLLVRRSLLLLLLLLLAARSKPWSAIAWKPCTRHKSPHQQLARLCPGLARHDRASRGAARHQQRIRRKPQSNALRPARRGEDALQHPPLLVLPAAGGRTSRSGLRASAARPRLLRPGPSEPRLPPSPPPPPPPWLCPCPNGGPPVLPDSVGVHR